MGVYGFTTEQTTTSPVSGPVVSVVETDVTLLHLGIGAFYLIPSTNNFQMYLGPRLGLNFVTSSSAGPYYDNVTRGYVQRTTESTETDFALGLTFGGECFAAREFSVGAEVEANYVSFGNPDITNTPAYQSSPSTTDRKQHIITTDALFFVRWYFVRSAAPQE